ncbi:MAG: ACT domain-containing protein [Lachnospiraceae bacterium]|nr:ACT domain-containing protein [Lachnospiraceae bacterium]
MAGKAEYFVLREKAIPEVLLKVVEAKRLLDLGKAASVQEAADAVGISRSSFYKYKDDIFPFHDNSRGRTITMMIQMDDIPGLLSVVLKSVADYQANVLTIHQSIPVGGVASLTISVEVLPDTGDISRMVEEIEGKTGVHYLKILARE